MGHISTSLMLGYMQFHYNDIKWGLTILFQRFFDNFDYHSILAVRHDYDAIY